MYFLYDTEIICQGLQLVLKTLQEIVKMHCQYCGEIKVYIPQGKKSPSVQDDIIKKPLPLLMNSIYTV